MLREERYLADARIAPVRYADGVVDIEVVTRDVWSLNPGVSFGRRGGNNHYGFEVQELNLFGRGIELDIDHASNVDRVTNSVELIDRHVWGRHTALALRYAHNSDGDGWLVALERPFYALDARWAAGGRAERLDQVDSLYSLGEEFERYRRQSQTGQIYWGRSSGLHDDWVQRWTIGIGQDRQQFSAVPDGFGTGLLPQDRELIYPWLGWERLQDDYRTWRNRDQIGRIEDVLLGTRLHARIGRAAAALGSDRDAWIYRFGASKGFALAAEDSLLLGAEVAGRYERGGDPVDADETGHASRRSADLQLDAHARFYHPLSERNLLFAKLEASWGHNLGLERSLLLGGDNGLRGYPLRYQGGDRRALLSLEQRYFTDWYPFRLFRVGAAVFFDAGRTWGDDGLGTPNFGWLKDAGIGLRLGNSRLSLGNVIHIDLAFPLDGPKEIDRVQLVVEARRAF
jgi:outer membrane protein assembly factor BamA